MAAALDKPYDGIIVGAGHHGLVLGSYLAKCGSRHLLVDRRLKYGGGLATKRSPRRASITTCTRSIISTSARRPGSRTRTSPSASTYITPRYEFGQAASRRLARWCSAATSRRRSPTSARFSRKDAQTFRDWNRKAEEITREIFLPERFAEPLPQAEREALLSQTRHRTRIPRRDAAPAVRRGQGAVRERARAAPVPVQGVAVRHLAGRYPVEDQPDGLGDPRLRSEERLPALPGRLVQPRPRADGDLHRRRRAFSRRSNIDKILIEGGKATGIALQRRPHRARRQFVASTLDVHQTFETLIGREQIPAAFRQEARPLPVHHVDPLRPASGAARSRRASPPRPSIPTSAAR